MNDSLSLRRSQAVIDILVGLGVQRQRFLIAVIGDNEPLAPNDTPQGRALKGGKRGSVFDTGYTGPDNTEITTETADGVTTETRTFKDPNSRVEKVVVTTRDGKRTARVYYRDKTVRELPESDVGRALGATGDALASAGGKVVDVSKDVGSTVADKTGDAAHAVGDKTGDAAHATVQGAKTAGRATANVADEAGEKTASGAKKAAKATAKGAKKVGGAINNAVTP